MNYVEVSFSIVLKSGEQYDHSVFLPKNLERPEIEKRIWEAVIDDKVWLENICVHSDESKH